MMSFWKEYAEALESRDALRDDNAMAIIELQGTQFNP
jgi:hypothetical protein